MEINVLEDKKNRMVFEVGGAGHTLCNALKQELYNDSHVKVATYAIRHSEISKPQIIVETDTDSDPRKALNAAVGRLKKFSEKFRNDFKKEVK